jgi:hypothetical protein
MSPWYNLSTPAAFGTFLALFMGTASPTYAQSSQPANPAAAEALFEEGRALMAAGDYAQACAKLAESHRLDAASGTLLNLAVCYQEAGKTASAWATFKEAAVLARLDNRSDRIAFAQKRIAALEPILSYLVIAVDPKSRVDGLTVRVDGVILGAAAWGTAIPTNPGKRRVEANAPEHEAWFAEVEVGAKGDRMTVTIPRLEVRSADTGEPTSATQQPRAEPQSDTGSWQAITVWSGAGLMALGMGAGILAISAKSSLDDQCDAGTCPESARSDHDALKRWGTVSTAGIGSGALLLGLGLWALGGEQSEVDGQELAHGADVNLSADGARVTASWRF